MEAVVSPGLVMTEQDLKTGLSLMGEGNRSAPASLPSLGIAVALDGVGQVAVAKVLQESPAAYSGQVGIGDVVEAVDGQMVTCVQQLAVAADGLDGTLVALELRRRGDAHFEPLHLMRQLLRDTSDFGSSDGERAGLGARVVHDARGMKVCDLYEGSSSYWSTLKIDDIVCAVDGQDIRHGPPSLVLQLTNGAIGTSMCLHVIRKEAHDDEVAGALSARGLGGHDGVAVNWKDGKEPAVSGNEKLIRVLVVRSRPLADSALSRALAYRARVVELLQARIERALLEGGVDLDTDDRTDEDASPGGHTGYTREPGDITKLSLSESSPVSDWQPASSFAAYGVDMHEKSDLSRQGGPSVNEGSQTDAKHSDSSPSMTPRTSKLESQLATLQDRHENEMRKLQDQIAGLADVIKSGNKISAGSNEESRAREVEKAEIASQASQLLLECVEKMRHQQLEEKKSTIALFQRVCQETMATQERMAGMLHNEIDEVRKQAGENSHVYRKLAEKVEQLNQNNVLLGNVLEGSVVKTTHPTENAAAGRNSVPQLPLSNPRLVRERALDEERNLREKHPTKRVPMNQVALARPTTQSPRAVARQHGKSVDEPVGVSITIGVDFDRVKKHEKRFSEDLMSACAWCLQASTDRFMYCHIERGSVIAKLNILPDSSGSDPRPCIRLAEELAAQVAHPHSPVRKAPVTKPATKVVIHQPISIGGSFQAASPLERLDEVEVGNVVESPQTASDCDMNSPRGEQELQEDWSEEQRQEELNAMKQRLQEMDAIVSNLASAHPIEPAPISASSERGSPSSNEDKWSGRTSDAYPPEPSAYMHIASSHTSPLPLKEQMPISVMDLSLEGRNVDAGRDAESKYSQPHKQHARASTASREADYRRLPNTSAIELESVLSRLEHHSMPAVAQSANRDISHAAFPRLANMRNGSKVYNPRDNEFSSPHPGAATQRMHEKGTITPGSETSMNASRRSPSPGEPKRWRVLPQWFSHADSPVNGKATPRVQFDTLRSQDSVLLSSARGAKEPQTLFGQSGAKEPQTLSGQSGVRLPDPDLSGPVSSKPSPNRRRREYVSDSSSDEESAGRRRVESKPGQTPLSSARSDTRKGEDKRKGDQNEKKLFNNAKSILNDSDSDEEIRVRASDLPVRRLVNPR